MIFNRLTYRCVMDGAAQSRKQADTRRLAITCVGLATWFAECAA